MFHLFLFSILSSCSTLNQVFSPSKDQKPKASKIESNQVIQDFVLNGKFVIFVGDIFKSKTLSLFKSYLGVVVFTGYLLYDFNFLKQRMNLQDDSWSSAVQIAVNIYLDIINLFLDLLEIMAQSGN